MEKKFVRVDIVDNQLDYGCEMERVMDTFILVNPNLDKLEELQDKLSNRFESGEFEQYSEIGDYIIENFEILEMSGEIVEIEW